MPLAMEQRTFCPIASPDLSHCHPLVTNSVLSPELVTHEQISEADKVWATVSLSTDGDRGIRVTDRVIPATSGGLLIPATSVGLLIGHM